MKCAIVLGIVLLILLAIAVPGLLQSQRASNERHASTMLKTVTSAEADFRSNDRDGNQVNDFWTADIAGLYYLDRGYGPLKLIAREIADADTEPLRNRGEPVPFKSYFYRALERDESDPSIDGYCVDTKGLNSLGNVYNTSKFGFCAYPVFPRHGSFSYIVNENNQIYRVPLERGIPRTWPEDTSIKSFWSR